MEICFFNADSQSISMQAKEQIITFYPENKAKQNKTVCTEGSVLQIKIPQSIKCLTVRCNDVINTKAYEVSVKVLH